MRSARRERERGRCVSWLFAEQAFERTRHALAAPGSMEDHCRSVRALAAPSLVTIVYANVEHLIWRMLLPWTARLGHATRACGMCWQ